MTITKKTRRVASKAFKTATGSSLPSGLLTAFLLLALLLTFSTIFYSFVEGWSLTDSLYFSVITVTTVGYGDFTPTQDISKLFTILLIGSGVGLAFFIFTALARSVINSRKNKLN